ncbi:MAG: hypothetical protein HKN30_01890 [Sulfitobacter sp.]|nr:hypothetical protein [Sulfitobacter sp.]
MTRSANEVMSLSSKAARGAGAPPEQAALFGRAALCHLAAAREAETLRRALEALPGGPILSLPPAFIVLQEEAAEAPGAELPAPAADPALIQSYAEAQPFLTTVIAASRRLTTDLNTPSPRLPAHRIALPKELAERMQALAARLLVPDTAASRLGGAGAGLTDND